MKIVLGKLARMVAAVVVVSFLTFVLTKQLPGDPAFIVLGTQANAMVPCGTGADVSSGNAADCRGISSSKLHARGDVGPAPTLSKCAADRCVLAREQFDHAHKLDKPVLQQYLGWAGGALHGDFGTTFDSSPQPVGHLIWQALPPTLEFMLLAEITALIVAIPLGVWSAYREGRLSDKATTGISFFVLAFPNFVLAIFLISAFVVALKWLPLLYTPWSDSPSDNIKSVVIPVVALAAPTLAVFVRLLRSDMIATLQEDFILMARAKGLPTWRILFQHALRPSSFSLLTVAGINLGTLIGGTVILEVMFQASGLGYLLTQAILTRNYPVVQGVVLLVSAGFVAVNVLVDILYSVLDPRIRNA